MPAMGGAHRSAGVSERAALIAELATAQTGTGFDANGESQLLEMLQDPLQVFLLLNPRDMPSSEQPDFAGASARIRSEIAATLGRPKLKKKRRAKAAAKPSQAEQREPVVGSQAGGATDDVAVPFEPSADDIAQALDGNQDGSSDNSNFFGERPPAKLLPVITSLLCLLALLTAIGVAIRLFS